LPSLSSLGLIDTLDNSDAVISPDELKRKSYTYYESQGKRSKYANDLILYQDGSGFYNDRFGYSDAIIKSKSRNSFNSLHSLSSISERDDISKCSSINSLSSFQSLSSISQTPQDKVFSLDSLINEGAESEKHYCRFCGTTSTPEWRKGPDGPGTLCNACGIKYSKSVNDLKESIRSKMNPVESEERENLATLLSSKEGKKHHYNTRAVKPQ